MPGRHVHVVHRKGASPDEGPIIEQEVVRVDQSLFAEKLAAAGRDVQRQALARTVLWHVENRILLNGHRTVVFG